MEEGPVWKREARVLGYALLAIATATFALGLFRLEDPVIALQVALVMVVVSVCLVLLFALTVLVHELGHLLAGWAVGMSRPSEGQVP